MTRPTVPMGTTRRLALAGAGGLALATFLRPHSAWARGAASEVDLLSAGFQSPPQAARPRVWWHWMNGNVTAEGAQLDLEWMKRVGIGGIHLFSGGGMGEGPIVERPLPFMSDGWREVFRQSTTTAQAAGMEMGIAASPGWSQTGATFVPPADGMKKYVWSVTRLRGGKVGATPLPLPPVAIGPFQGVSEKSASKQLTGPIYGEACVIAFPTPAGDRQLTPKLSASDPQADLSKLVPGAFDVGATVPLGSDDRAWIDVAFERSTPVSGLTLAVPNGVTVEVLASTASGWRSLTRQNLIAPSGTEHPCPHQTLSFMTTSARQFRVVLTLLPPSPILPGLPPFMAKPRPRPSAFTINAFEVFAAPRINRFEAKAGFETSIDSGITATPEAAPNGVVAARTVLDLSNRLQADGRLDWTPPNGDWTVIRFGWTLTGRANGPAEPEATGLEVDKLDPAAVRRYIDSYLALYQDASGGRLGPDGVDALLTDSWEAGFQNWTPALLAEFKARRGYDPLPYTAVLAGWVVDSADASERFLWDFRLTLKELVVDAHYGVLAKAAKARGMRYYTEASGDNPRVLADGMSVKARADIPTAEFWFRNFASGPRQLSLKADLLEAASAAHVYGKPLAAAESLTVAAGTDPWSFSPAMMKPVADAIFAHGINRLLLHESRHQPFVDKKPGLTLAIFGQYFNRNETWAEEAAPFVTYLARTSHMLQQGQFVADVAYFYGEDRTLTELFRTDANADVPKGYAYDYINREALLTLLSVKDGRVVTPSGMSYRVLFVPPTVTHLTLPALRKLGDLVRAGAILVAPRPTGGLGQASADREILALTDALWGADPIDAGGRVVGAGRLYATLEQALAREAVIADCRLEDQPDAELLWLHRRTPDADIYFVSNQKDRREDLRAIFRVEGKAPEIWRAAMASREPAGFVVRDDGIETALSLEPHEAIFVIFRRDTALASFDVQPARLKATQDIAGPWTVTFSGLAAPDAIEMTTLASWTQAADPLLKYYSGAAVYRTEVRLQRSWLAPGQRIFLDLGKVHDLAVVTVNGRSAAATWHAPFRVDVTDALRPGRNEIAVRVVNLWRNRLIGDKQPGAKPVTFAPMAFYSANSPLLDSGLLGPVRLIAEEVPTSERR